MMSEAERLAPIELRATGLRKSFGGVEVLHGIDLDVHGGEILALLGENGAGKSTAIKILSGDYQPDGGTVTIDGKPVALRDPREAHQHGIRVIYQEFNDAPDLSVAENLHLGALVTSGNGIVRWPEVRASATAALQRVGVELDVTAQVGTLGVAQRQVVEIARALIGNARLLVLDEPTSALSDTEARRLFDLMHTLRADGVALIYITHRLDELDEIADRVAVFRDGYESLPATPFADLTRSDIVEAMVGEVVDIGTRRASTEPHEGDFAGPPAVVVDGVSVAPEVHDVSFGIPSGQITVLFGRVGCGAVELAQGLFGVRQITSGSVTLQDGTTAPQTPRTAIDAGFGYVSADRKQRSLLTGLGVAENLTVASWSRVARHGVLQPSRLKTIFSKWSRELSIAAPGGAKQPIETLSGGNQQKAILGRWFERDADVLILVEPTRGVDVKTRAEIYQQLEAVAEAGAAVLVVSSDIEEVVRLGTRVHVMADGELVGSFAGDEVTRAELVETAGRSALSVAGTD